ncbi:MAG: hypothetical protein ACD_5C00009G0004 [uncultured bacterium]|nr:MAG: hypothetical protein ACD_5C00009G0004 [uncultured bacterium]
MNVDNATLFWLLFYIAVGVLGIFLTLVYIASKKPTSKRSR